MSAMTVGELRTKLGAYPDAMPVRILDFTGDLGEVGMEYRPRPEGTACVLEWEPIQKPADED